MGKSKLTFTAKFFNVKHTLECGQCFRWSSINENEYIGIIEDRAIKIKQEKDSVCVYSSKEEKLKEVVFNYFNLYEDYECIEDTISKTDNNIKEALKHSSGIHILNQPLFETIISYIISANNNIKRISRSINKISEKFGQEIEYDNKKYYLFPTVEQLAKATTDDLLECGVGFRARYIMHITRKINENINILNELEKMNTEEAKKVLLGFMGIGPKVADCILLFALKRGEVFPIDVWIKRIMEKLYFNGDTDVKLISDYAKKNYGNYAGIIQQHLFYNVRESNI